MLISHETPISILKQSLQYNDYDYCLVHLCESHPEYYSFFKTSIKKNRHVLLDNSIFELGVSFDPVKYAKVIEDLRPTEYIVPDVLEDKNGTCESLERWLKDYKDLPGKRIAVIQGKTYEELKDCLAFIYNTKQISKIGISFDYSYYKELFDSKVGVNSPVSKHTNIWEKFCIGRNLFLQKLEEDIALPRNVKYHLLGCSLPQEFKYAKKFNFIKGMFESVDTSSPVVHGLYKIEYDRVAGLQEKNSMKLADLIDTKVSPEQLDIIKYNAGVFKSFVNEGYKGI